MIELILILNEVVEVFYYGQEVFEGFKVYWIKDGQVNFFCFD